MMVDDVIGRLVLQARKKDALVRQRLYFFYKRFPVCL
jgi:hypothetical protein